MGSFAPPKVSRELAEKTRRSEAHAFLGLTTDDGSRWWRDWNRDLEAFLPGLRLCWCPDPAPVEAVALGARPGRWGLLFPSMHGGPVTVQAFRGPNDEFVEPGAWVFDLLRAHDWQNAEVMRDRARAEEEAERAAARRKAQEEEDFDRECLERWLSVSRAQVSMNRSVPWSQSHAGRRGVDRGDHDTGDR